VQTGWRPRFPPSPTTPHPPTPPTSLPPYVLLFRTPIKRIEATQVPRVEVTTTPRVGANPPKVYNFPTALPTTILTSQQKKENYGIPKDDTPFCLGKEISHFSAWSQDPINLTRGLKYAHAIQSSTLDGQLKHIRGFMGYVSTYFNVEPYNLSLTHYADPEVIASFISYLRARNVMRHSLMAHAGEGPLPIALRRP
jgi:hypothetical protein